MFQSIRKVLVHFKKRKMGLTQIKKKFLSLQVGNAVDLKRDGI